MGDGVNGVDYFEFKAKKTTAEQQMRHYTQYMKPGQVYRFTAKPHDEHSESAFRYFHALRDAYAAKQGYTKDWAKIELKWLYGINEVYSEVVYKDGELIEQQNPHFEPPTRAGKFKPIYEGTADAKMIFQISTKDYTQKEMMHLIEGTLVACGDVGAEIDSVIKQYGGRR